LMTTRRSSLTHSFFPPRSRPPPPPTLFPYTTLFRSACNRDEPCRRSSRRGTPSESRAAENDAARRKVVRLANVGGSDAEGDHLASAFGALRDAVRSFRCHSARPTLDPGGHCRRLCRRSIVPGGWRGSCVRGRLRRVGFRAAKRFRY